MRAMRRTFMPTGRRNGIIRLYLAIPVVASPLAGGSRVRVHFAPSDAYARLRGLRQVDACAQAMRSLPIDAGCPR